MAKLQPRISEGRRLSIARKKLRNSGIFDITEFGRTVHAEMDALMCAGRSGISARHSTLYTTTFPCHNCARHLIAAGVNRVVYIEPYPKSKALLLHNDSIAIEEPGSAEKIPFEPFLGVGPRRYFDLFSMALSTGYPMVRKKNGKVLDWKHSNASPRVPMQPTSYLHRELRAAEEIKNIVESWNESKRWDETETSWRKRFDEQRNRLGENWARRWRRPALAIVYERYNVVANEAKVKHRAKTEGEGCG
jgi:tRNA(Arg) A34 adenosine deaminase TadA